MLAEYQVLGGAPVLVTRYVHGPRQDEIILQQKTTQPTTAYLHEDALGSTYLLTDAAGAPVESYSYTAFGEVTAYNMTGGTVASPATRFLYTGREWIAQLGINDHRNRFYDMGLGRWLSRDSIGERGGINLYGYTYNNPINLWDPLGLDSWQDAAGDWFFERGTENRSYDSSHQITRDVMCDEGVQEARNAWNAAGRPDSFTYNYEFGVNDYLREFFTLDGTGSFLGGYQVNITKCPDGSTGFDVNNTTGWESGTRSPIPSARGNPSVEDMRNGAPFTPNPRSILNDRPRSAPGPGGNFRQTYYWNEP